MVVPVTRKIEHQLAKGGGIVTFLVGRRVKLFVDLVEDVLLEQEALGIIGQQAELRV